GGPIEAAYRCPRAPRRAALRLLREAAPLKQVQPPSSRCRPLTLRLLREAAPLKLRVEQVTHRDDEPLRLPFGRRPHGSAPLFFVVPLVQRSGGRAHLSPPRPRTPAPWPSRSLP